MNPEEKPGAVFDCNIYFQATRNANGPAAKVFRLLEEDRFTLFVSNEVMNEVRATLTNPGIRAKNPRFTDKVIDALLELVSKHSMVLQDIPERFTYQRDPDDAKYVNLALAAGARYLVTRDKDLLDLMNEDSTEGKDFRTQFPELMILDPVSFLQQMSPAM